MHIVRLVLFCALLTWSCLVGWADTRRHMESAAAPPPSTLQNECVSTNNNGLGWNNNANRNWVGSPFTVGASGYKVTRVDLDVTQFSSPTQTGRICIYTYDDQGTPGDPSDDRPGTQIGTCSDDVRFATLPVSFGTWTPFNNVDADVAASTTYFWVAKSDPPHQTGGGNVRFTWVDEAGTTCGAQLLWVEHNATGGTWGTGTTRSLQVQIYGY